MSRARRVLVVGGRGFLGSHVVTALLSHHAAVAMFGPDMPVDLLGALASQVESYEGSAEDEPALRAALAAFRPEAVVWAAGRNAGGQGLAATAEAEVARAVGVNAGGFAALLHAAAGAAVPRIVQAGSVLVYGPGSLHATGRVTEAAPAAPRTAYGLSKLMGEQAAAYGRDRLGLEVATVRLPLLFGPSRWYAGSAGPLMRLLLAAARRAPVREEVPPGRFDLAYGPDAGEVFARLALLPEAPPPLLNLEGITASYREIAAALQHLAPDAPAPELVERRTIEPAPLMDGSLLRRRLEWEPVWSFAAAASDMLAQHGRKG
jgi:UDP-glucose 4-epimerase